MARFYISTPIYYVNDMPHIGHVYTTVVADVVARYRRLVGDEVFFATGTDEHGQNILRTAEEKGIEPQEQADQVVSRYYELWNQLAMSHDDFIRTTEARHRQAVRTLIDRIDRNGDFYVAKHDGWYCSSCESFYTEKELGAGATCPIHEKKTEWHAEENVFFRLSKYQDRLLELYAANPSFVRPESRANEVRSFVEGGLKDLSVSRAGLPWGVAFPDHPGQTVYVWLDALTNYLSILGFGGDQDTGDRYRGFWAEGHTRIHLVGKDILRFHAVYWPAFLMSAGLPLPTTVWAHGWWLRDQRKVSKSVGNIVRLDDLMSRFGADPVRYFLLREMVFGQDASFSDEGFIDRFNSDLANDLGNTVSRIVKLCRRAFDGQTPPEACSENPVMEAAQQIIPEFRAAMDDFSFHRALAELWRLLSAVNQYLVEREPWKLIKNPDERIRVSRILWNALEGVRIVATGLVPFMPTLAPKVLAAVGAGEQVTNWQALEWGQTPLSAPLPGGPALFPRVDKEAFLAGTEIPPKEAEESEEDQMISIDDFFKSKLKVATVVAASAIPKAKKLLKLEVDLGEDAPRTLVAGIAEHYAPDELVGRQVVVVANLQPAKLMGVESQGMVLAASIDGRPVLLHPGTEVPVGTLVK